MIDLYELVTTLTGPIRPVGVPGKDQGRHDNMLRTMLLISKLSEDIAAVANGADSPQLSVQGMGKEAEAFLDGLAEAIKGDGACKSQPADGLRAAGLW